MKFIDVKLSRLIPGPAGDVFDAWFDLQSPRGPWHAAKKVIMNLVVDGMFYYGIERQEWIRHMREDHGVLVQPGHAGGLLGHFGRFVAIDRPRAVEHTWMSENKHEIETTVSVTFEAREGGTLMTILHRGVPDDERAANTGTAGRSSSRGSKRSSTAHAQHGGRHERSKPKPLRLHHLHPHDARKAVGGANRTEVRS